MNKLIEALAQAYVGESQARNRYTLYAKQAKKEDLVQISQIFLETSEHEKSHGKNFFRMIQKVMDKLGERVDMFEIDKVGVPVVHGSTIENLKAAVAGEHHEFSEMYPAIAKIAKDGRLSRNGTQITAIATAENHHEVRYQKLLDQRRSS